MENCYKVLLSSIIKDLLLEVIYMPKNGDNIEIETKNVSRPALELTGFFEHYDNQRILIIGNTEYTYLELLSEKERYKSLKDLISKRPPTIIICRDLKPFDELLELVKEYDVSLLKTKDSTSNMLGNLVTLLNVELAPRITRHGVLIEAYGEGIFLTGDSGVGKSETAIELVNRGHRLIADDAVEIRKVSNKSLIGSSPKNIRHYLELRGIGIINARRLFGMGAIKLTEKIDLVINLEIWNDGKAYDRLGIKDQYINILGIEIPLLTIPVKPGRNLAVIIEVAAMNNRQKRMGYNAGKELLNELGMKDEEEFIK